MEIDRLKRLREDLKISQTLLAKNLNITTARYNHYENGKREPDNDILKQIADFFNVSTDYLLGTTSDPTPKDKQIFSEYELAKVFQNKLLDVGIDISDEKEQETLLNFIETNKDTLRILIEKRKE